MGKGCCMGGHIEPTCARLILSILIIVLALIGGNIGKVGVILGALAILVMAIKEKQGVCCIGARKASRKK